MVTTLGGLRLLGNSVVVVCFSQRAAGAARASGARSAPTFSTVEEARTDLIQHLAVLKPYRILYIADAEDLEERAEHLQQVLKQHIVRPMAVLLGLLCSCAGPMQQAGQQAESVDAYDDRPCTGYGLKPLDPEHARCRRTLAQMRHPGDPPAAVAALTIETLALRSVDRQTPEP